MDVSARIDALHRVLERAAEQLGDLTPYVYHAYYDRRPEAGAYFDAYYPGGRRQLEGSMVEQALHCIMEWLESPGEIEVILIGTIPHHVETLGIPASAFAELISTLCDVIVDTIPSECRDEARTMADIRSQLLALCEVGAQLYVKQSVVNSE